MPRGRCAAVGHRLALGEPAQPDQRPELGGGHLRHDGVIGVGGQRGHLVQQRGRAGRIAGRRLAPCGAEHDIHPQRLRRIRGQQFGGPAVGGQRRTGIAHDRAQRLAPPVPGHRLPLLRELRQGRLPLALEVTALAEPAEGLGQLQPEVNRLRIAAHRLGPEPGRLRHRAQRPGVPRGPLPARAGQVVAAGGRCRLPRPPAPATQRPPRWPAPAEGSGGPAHPGRPGPPRPAARAETAARRRPGRPGRCPGRLPRRRRGPAPSSVADSSRPAAASTSASSRAGRARAPVAARTAARRFCGGALRPAASARALSTASSGLPSAARTTCSTAWSVSSATLRATAASSTADSGPRSSSATSTPRPARSASRASAAGRTGLSRRVSTNSTGRAASRRPMCAPAACWPDRRGAHPRRPGPPAGRARPTPPAVAPRRTAAAAPVRVTTPQEEAHPGPAGRRRPGRACPVPPAAALLRGREDSAGELRHQFLPHGQRRLAADVHPGAHRDPCPGIVSAAGQFGDQAGLADAGGPVTRTTRPVPGARRRPGRHQRAKLRGAPEQRAPRAGPASNAGALGPPRASASAARSIGLGRTPSSSRSRAVTSRPTIRAPARSPTGRGELPHQVRMRGLVQRVQFAAQPRPPRRSRGVTIPFGRRGPGFQRLGQFGSQLPPRGLGPVFGIFRQQLAVAQRGRGRQVASGGAAAAVGEVHDDRFRAQPDRGARRRSARRHRLPCAGPTRRYADSPARPPRRCRATGVPPRLRGRGAPGAQQGRRAAGQLERELLAIAFGGHCAQQPYRTRPGLYPPLTLRFARLSGLSTLRSCSRRCACSG